MFLGMRDATLVILLALAPLSWGEDVWYCAEEAVRGLGFSPDQEVLEQFNVETSKFTLKHSPESNQVIIDHRAFKIFGIELLKLDCVVCNPSGAEPLLAASSPDQGVMFGLKGNKFSWASMDYGNLVTSAAGTCTKF